MVPSTRFELVTYRVPQNSSVFNTNPTAYFLAAFVDANQNLTPPILTSITLK